MRAAHALAALLVAASTRAAEPPPVEVGVASALEKLRPDGTVPRQATVDLAAPRGGCDSAQIAVRSASRLEALEAEARLEGAPPIPVALYRVATVALDRASGPDGAAGEWPDPLVPERDPSGERRRAFPVAVPPGRLQAIWVEVCVPGDAAPGGRAGAVALRDGGRRLAEVPMRLTVWPVALPATSSLPVTFGLSTILGTRALGVPGDRQAARALAAAALRHRVTPHGLSMEPPSGSCRGGRCQLDWSDYDAEMEPLLDGKLVPGTRATFAEVRSPAWVWKAAEDDAVAWLREWRRHFEARGWADRLWLYTMDEPGPADLPELARRARLARQAGVRVFATTVPAPALSGLVDAYSPNLTFFEPGGPLHLGSPRGDGAWAAPLGRPFWYLSCLSHGCGEIPDSGPQRRAMIEAFAGWPGYEIDRPGAATRCMGWLAYRYGIGGELYYDMLQAWARRDPWREIRAFAGNGDGTLLYPGLPGALGGERPFPVESIRLKLIRAGLEDYELLRLSERSGLGGEARRLAAELVPSPRRFERLGARYLAARRELGEALARAAAR